MKIDFNKPTLIQEDHYLVQQAQNIIQQAKNSIQQAQSVFQQVQSPPIKYTLTFNVQLIQHI